MGSKILVKKVSKCIRCLACGISAAIITSKVYYDVLSAAPHSNIDSMPPPIRASSLVKKSSLPGPRLTRNQSAIPSHITKKPCVASSLKTNASNVTSQTGIVTRRQISETCEGENRQLGKRKAGSPLEKNTKRSAFGDLTNANRKTTVQDSTKGVKTVPIRCAKALGTIKTKLQDTKTAKVAPHRPAKVPKQPTRRSQLVSKAAQASKEKVPPHEGTVEPRITRRSARLSAGNESSENSLYVSALEDIGDDFGEEQLQETKVVESPARRVLPSGVDDFDGSNENDPNQVSDYAMDIFEYLKSRESLYQIGDYMEKQVSLSRWMRSLLIDWMVEVQENFELNHETLYLAVKVVDIYLSKVIIGKERLQLVGAAAMFISSKFDERTPPLVDDLIYICDGAYNHDELIKMEINILREIDFDLNMPLSYRFLRRYARCARVALPQLTLARFILELSLMEYSIVSMSDSKLAAGALLLALKMQNLGGWTPTLEYYSGYKLQDIQEICVVLNEMLHKKPKSALETVRNKYSHKVFFEVAKIPLITLEF